MEKTYREKATGKDQKLEIRHSDAVLVIFKRDGRMPETLKRSEFDEAWEQRPDPTGIQLPAVDPRTIPLVPVERAGGMPDPLGPPIPSSSVPDDAAFKMLRALGTELADMQDRLQEIGGKLNNRLPQLDKLAEIGAKVDAMFKVIVSQPDQPEKPKAPSE